MSVKYESNTSSASKVVAKVNIFSKVGQRHGKGHTVKIMVPCKKFIGNYMNLQKNINIFIHTIFISADEITLVITSETV